MDANTSNNHSIVIIIVVCRQKDIIISEYLWLSARRREGGERSNIALNQNLMEYHK